MMIYALATAATLLFGSPPINAQPTGKWVVEFAETDCLASHNYVSGLNTVTLGLEPEPASDTELLILLVPANGARFKEAVVTIGAEPIEAQALHLYGHVASGDAIYKVQLTQAESVRLSSANSLQVSAGNWTASFSLPQLAEVRAMLDRCTAKLLSSLGFAESLQAQVATYPKPDKDRSGLIFDSDYPDEALQRHAMGEVKVKIDVDQSGRGTRCSVIESSHDAALDSTTCRIYTERAHFFPARNKQGNAIPAPYITSITWALE